MSLTARDKKILIFLIPLVVLLGYWFLVLSPQRADVAKLDTELSTAEGDRDDAQALVSQLENSRTNYAKDYSTVVRLGKAIPSTLDMPSLLVQLESAAKGAKIDFDSITVGQREQAAAGSGATDTTTSTPASAAGGEKAQTGPGKAAESANNASQTSDNANQAAGADQGSANSGGSGSATGTTSGVAGLDTVPLTFTFTGSYFDLADFFHRVKRFVRVANDDIRVRGRLMTIDTMGFTSENFPRVTANVTASVYLAPKSEGTTGGATSSGPQATPASTGSGSGGSSGAQPASSTATEGAQ